MSCGDLNGKENPKEKDICTCITGSFCRELYSVSCGDLNGKENPKEKDICTCITGSFCRTAEINTTS